MNNKKMSYIQHLSPIGGRKVHSVFIHSKHTQEWGTSQVPLCREKLWTANSMNPKDRALAMPGHGAQYLKSIASLNPLKNPNRLVFYHGHFIECKEASTTGPQAPRKYMMNEVGVWPWAFPPGHTSHCPAQFRTWLKEHGCQWTKRGWFLIYRDKILEIMQD